METVADQERRGRAYAADHWPGVPIVVHADNALTAADEDVYRPGYEALRDAIRSRTITHLWCIEQSRLERTEIGWFSLAADLVAAGITEVHTRRDGIVRPGEDVAGIKAVLAAGEIRRLTRRVLDKHEVLAAQGRPRGGREFGYRHGRNGRGEATLEVVPAEAEAARWAAGAILAGWSLTSVAEELNARGVALPRGGKAWSTGQVRRVLTKGTIAGFRVYKGKVIGRATWAPILDETTWRQVQAVLDTRPTVTDRNGQRSYINHTRRAGRRHLLTGGIARCGLCDAPLVGQQRRLSGPQGLQPYYSCHPSKGGCSRIGIKGRPLEDHVRDRLLAELDRRSAFGAALAQDEAEGRRRELADGLARLDQRDVDLARRWAADEITGAAWDAARSDLAVQRAQLTVDLAAVPPPPMLVEPDELCQGWDLMTIEERRHIVRQYVAGVVVAPAVPGRQRFDPDRIAIDWR